MNVFEEKSNLVFEITDNGIGISEEMQKRIFEKFYQADNQVFSSEKGSGLGLSITKKIVEIHNGQIKFNSTLNKGTTFKIYLPY